MLLKTLTISQKELNHYQNIDEQGVSERISRIQSKSFKGETKNQGLKMALNMIDLTTLEGKDTPGKIKQLCYKAQHLMDTYEGIPTVAAVCVYPSFVRLAKTELSNSSIKVASVATAFPSGQSSLAVKLEETKYALEEGADEIDMVISRGKFLIGDYNYVFDEIAQIKEICGTKTLKVILETGEFGSLENVRLASEIAMQAGADFIKTSTGKISPAATLPVTYIMLEAIKEYYEKTGKKIGMKPAGGISTSKLALHYLWMVNEVLGQEWLTNELFRFGASSLANDVLMQLVKMKTGNYQSANYFPID